MTPRQPEAATRGIPVATTDGRVGGSLFRPAVVLPGAPLLVCVHGSGCSSRYFDLATNSLVANATRRYFHVLLVDRPGHGASMAPMAGSTIDLGVAAVVDLVAAVRDCCADTAGRPLAMVGHSFGGAIALAYAAASRAVPPAAVCVSGIGDRPDAQYAATTRGGHGSDVAARPAPYWLFGPGTSYDWRGVTALRAAAAAWRPEEVDEVTRIWPARWHDVAARISCPVQVRLAEFERIWEATPTAIDRIAAAFTRAARVDVAIAPGGGHLYEVHLRGPELVAAQLDFVHRAVAG